MPFSARGDAMSLGTLRASDVPPGPIRAPKDYDRSLYTQDLPRARPLLAHPTNGCGEPVPWNNLRKPTPPEVPKAKPKPLYPPVDPERRQQDLSLKTSDIDFAFPCRFAERRPRTDRIVDPLTPRYRMPTWEAAPPPTVRSSGRDTLDVSDIEGAAPAPTVPVRREYRDNLHLEAEFRTPRGGPVQAQDPWRANRPAAPGEARPACCTPDLEGPARSGRSGHNPLDPKYRVPLAAAPALATSLHARWAEERRARGDVAPTTESQDIGHIHGSRPGERKAGEHGGGALLGNKPQFCFQTEDVEGAQPMRRVGIVPFNIYGARGNREPVNSSLNTGDIVGAQAGTRPHGPRMPNTARSAGPLAATGARAVADAGEGPGAMPGSGRSSSVREAAQTMRPAEMTGEGAPPA